MNEILSKAETAEMRRQLIASAKSHLGVLAQSMIAVPEDLPVTALRKAIHDAMPEIDNIVGTLEEYRAVEISAESVALCLRLQTAWAALVFCKDELLRDAIIRCGKNLQADLDAMDAEPKTLH